MLQSGQREIRTRRPLYLLVVASLFAKNRFPISGTML